MKITYNWYILGASGKLITPMPYTDEYDDMYELTQGYDSEYQAIFNLEQYLNWDCPGIGEQFTLVKTYEYR